MGQRGCGSCHCLGDTADVASSPGRQHLGSMWSCCPWTLWIVAAAEIPSGAEGPVLTVGLEQPPGWTVSRGAAGPAGPCTAAGGGMRNADVRSEQEISGHA